jgi:DnaJ-class molecular chaperone
LATEGKRDYYQVLGVARTAADHEIRAAFQKLVTEFHAAGKPKTTDDVEWLRLLRRAYDVLSDKERKRHYDLLGEEISAIPTKPVGYDPENVRSMSRTVDDEVKKKRNYWIMREILGFFFGWTF